MLSGCSGKQKQYKQHEHGETHFSLGSSVGRKGAGAETRLKRTFWQIKLEMEDNTYCLGTDLLLGPGQQKDIMVVLDKKWGEDTLVSQHPDFDEPEVEVVGVRRHIPMRHIPMRHLPMATFTHGRHLPMAFTRSQFSLDNYP